MFVNIENRGKNRGACDAARTCALTRASHMRDKLPATVAPSVSLALKPPLSVEAAPPLAPVLAPAFELWKLQPAAFVGQGAPQEVIDAATKKKSGIKPECCSSELIALPEAAAQVSVMVLDPGLIILYCIAPQIMSRKKEYPNIARGFAGWFLAVCP